MNEIVDVHRDTRRAGLLYLAASIPALAGYFYIRPRIFVAGNVAATVQNIVAREQLYRVGILAECLSAVLFLFTLLALYRLFRHVDRGNARAMAALLAVGIAAQISGLAYDFAPLVLLVDTELGTLLGRPQAEALAAFMLRVGRRLGDVVAIFWGLWLFPFAVLVFKSRFLPRFLGVLLLVSGAAYLITSGATIVAPSHARAIFRVTMPLYFAEFIVVLWLALLGARPGGQEPRERGDEASASP